MLTFWEIRSFLKIWLAEICGKNHLFQKRPNFAISKHCSAFGPSFLDSLHHSTSITLITDWKKFHFWSFSLKKDIFTTFVTTTLVNFLFFCTCTQKLGYYQHFDFFMMSWKYKNRPSLCSTCLGCARSRFIWVCHGHCD